MKNFLLTIAGIVLFIIFIVGAFTLVKIIMSTPSVILASTECDPPCWYGIRPGQTNSSQVDEILRRQGVVNIDTIIGNEEGNDEITHITWYFQRPAVDGIGTIYFDKDEVTAINILTANSLKLADLFKKLGQPEKCWTVIGYGENREYLDVVLLYPTKGYLAEVVININNGSNQVKLETTTPVFRVTYFVPEMFQELWEARELLDISIDPQMGTFQAWSGYGMLSFERK